MSKQLAFPGGAGGNWVKKTLYSHNWEEFSEVDQGGHFHQGNDSLYELNLTHDFEQADFRMNGDCCLNVYLNQTVKFHKLQNNSYKDKTWSEAFNQTINNAFNIATLYSQARIYPVDLDYRALFLNPSLFHVQLNCVAEALELEPISRVYYEKSRMRYIQSCVSTEEVFCDWDNELWVAYVLGDLQYQEIYPHDIDVMDENSYPDTVKWAQEHVRKCLIVNSWVPMYTDIKVSGIKDLAN